MNRSPRSLLLVASLLCAASPAFAQPASAPAGHWEGRIQMPDHPLDLTVDLAKGPAGSWIGSMSIPGSTTVDVPLDTVTVDAAVRFTASLPGNTSFEGRLSEDAHTLSGTASNAEGGVPFQLARTGDAHVKIPPPSSPLTAAFEGTWSGTIEIGGHARRVMLKLAAGAGGAATGTLISVDKGLEFPVTTVTLHDAQIQLDVRVISGAFRGALTADGQITGEWTEGAVPLPLTFKRVS
jgi:hypothetical protein